jgi:hypothetical protein
MFAVGRSGHGGLNCEVEECLMAVLYRIAELVEPQTVEQPTPPPLYTEKPIRNQRVVFHSPDVQGLRSVFLISTRRSHPNSGLTQT